MGLTCGAAPCASVPEWSSAKIDFILIYLTKLPWKIARNNCLKVIVTVLFLWIYAWGSSRQSFPEWCITVHKCVPLSISKVYVGMGKPLILHVGRSTRHSVCYAELYSYKGLPIPRPWLQQGAIWNKMPRAHIPVSYIWIVPWAQSSFLKNWCLLPCWSY